MYTVEKKGFRKFVNRLASKIQIRCRRFFTNKVNALFAKGKEKLMKDLSNAKYACTTADCWTIRRKSFLDVTVHWLDSNLQVNTLVDITKLFTKALTISIIEEECMFCNS
jgi:hypothetical protein